MTASIQDSGRLCSYRKVLAMPNRQSQFLRRLAGIGHTDGDLTPARRSPVRTGTGKLAESARRPDSEHALTQDAAWAWMSLPPAGVATANALPAYEVAEHSFPDDLDMAGFLDLIRRLN
jgi:hypothetical protein